MGARKENARVARMEREFGLRSGPVMTSYIRADTLRQTACSYLELLNTHDGSAAHGYKVNAALARLQRLYHAEYDEHLWRRDAETKARELCQSGS